MSLIELVLFQDGETPLHIASSRGHLDCVRYLLDARAEVDVPNDAAVGGNTPLHLSIMRHYTNVAMLLLHAGADFDFVRIPSFPVLFTRISSHSRSVVLNLFRQKSRLNDFISLLFR